MDRLNTNIAEELVKLMSPGCKKPKQSEFSLGKFSHLQGSACLNDLYGILNSILGCKFNRQQLKIKAYLSSLVSKLTQKSNWSHEIENIYLVLISLEFISFSTKANITFFMNFIINQLKLDNIDKDNGLYLVQEIQSFQSNFIFEADIREDLKSLFVTFSSNYSLEEFPRIDYSNLEFISIIYREKKQFSYIQRLLLYKDRKSRLVLVNEYIVKSSDVSSRVTIKNILKSFKVLSKLSNQELISHYFKGISERIYGKFHVFAVFFQYDSDPDSELKKVFEKSDSFKIYLKINHVLKLFTVLYKKKIFLVPDPELFFMKKDSTRINILHICLFFDLKNNEFNKTLLLAGPFGSLIRQELNIENFQIEKISVFLVGTLLKNLLNNLHSNHRNIPEIFRHIAKIATLSYENRPSFKEIFKVFQDFNMCQLINQNPPENNQYIFIKNLRLDQIQPQENLKISQKLKPSIELVKLITQIENEENQLESDNKEIHVTRGIEKINAIQDTEEFVCLKHLVFNIEEEKIRMEQIENELKIMIMLNTIQKKKKYFLTFRDSFESLSNQTKIITIETEYIDHTLNKPEVYQLPLKKKVIISKNILKALYLMHKNLFFHLDIKPQNILVDIKSLKIRIIDFDISRKLLPEDSIDKFQVPIRGTVSYAEPSIKELLKSKSLDSKPINISKCDVFSAGVTFFELFFKDFQVDKEDINYEELKKVNPEIYSILGETLEGMTAKDESSRWDLRKSYFSFKSFLKAL